MSVKVNTSGPRMQDFIERVLAGNPKEWGDGSILDAIKQIIEMIMPFIMQCFPASSKFARNRFIATAQRMSGFRQRRIQELCDEQATKVLGITAEDEKAVAEAAANGVIETLPWMTKEDLGALFDELYEV